MRDHTAKEHELQLIIIPDMKDKKNALLAI